MKENKLIEPGKWYSEFGADGSVTKVIYEKTYRHLLGYESEDEYANDEAAWENSIHPDDVERLNKHFAECLNMHPEGMDLDIEYRMMTKNGYHWFHDHGYIVRDDDGRPVNCYGVVFDIQDTYEKVSTNEAVGENNMRILALEDKFESLYDVEIETGACAVFVKGETYDKEIRARLKNRKNYFEDLRENVEAVIYSEDRKKILDCLSKEGITRALTGTDHYDLYYRVMVQNKPVWFKFRLVYKDEAKKNVIIGVFNAEEEMEAKKKADLARKEETAKMAGGISAYIVNPETGRFQILSQNKHLSDNYPEDEDFNTSFSRYIANDVYEPDRPLVTESITIPVINKHLAKEPEYVVRYRDISTGAPRWYEFRAVKLSENEIMYGFADKDNEVNNLLISEKIGETFVALFYVNLDSGLVSAVKEDPMHMAGAVGDIVPYKDMMAKLVESFEGETKEFLIKISDIPYLKKRFENEDKAYYTYKSHLEEGRWGSITELVLARHEDGTPSIFALGFSLLDDDTSEKEELRLKLKESKDAERLVENIATQYDIAFCVNMAEDNFKVLRGNEKYDDDVRQFTRFSDIISFLASEKIHPSDREFMRKELDYDNIRTRLSETNNYSVEYRVLLNGVTIWHEMSLTNITDDEIAIGFAERDLEITKRQLEEKRYSEYLALFMIDLDTAMIKPVKTSPHFATADVGEAAPYEISMRKFAAMYEGDTRDFFMKLSKLDYIRKELANDDKWTYSYKSSKLGDDKWIDVISYVTQRHENGTPAMVSLGFSVVDSLASASKEMLNKINEDMQMIGGLASEYHTLYYVNIDEKLFKIYNFDKNSYPELEDIVVGNGDPFDKIRKFGLSELVHADDRKFFDNLDSEFVRKKLNHNKKYTYRFRRNYKGKYVWLEMDMVKYEAADEKANAIAVGFANRDEEIREEIRQNDKLENAVRVAKEANQSKTNFLFNMSHDIRTPMNAILGFTSMAKKHVNDVEKVSDCLDKIDTSGFQLLSLVNQVLEMARIESGKIELEEKPVDIVHEFESMVTVLSQQAEANGLVFCHTLGNITHRRILADRARMGSITLNITGNALKYTPKGGRIDFSLVEITPRKPSHASFVFSVEDTGIGMSEEYLKILFDPFTREKNSTVSKIQGTGLGMAIVKDLVDLMGGHISVQSEVGKGTRFEVVIDFKIDVLQPKEEATNNFSDDVGLEGRRVLLVEDNELNREIATEIMSDEGLLVDEADDGTTAIEMLNDKGPEFYDFILMDIQMPIMNGYEATKAIREMYPHLTTPIIALSANAFSEDREASVAAGMDDHVAKPIDINELFRVMGKYVK